MPTRASAPPIKEDVDAVLEYPHTVCDFQILQIADVCLRTTLCPTTIYKLIRDGLFPAPMRLGKRTRGWPDYVIDAWLESCMALRSQMCRLKDRVELPVWTPEMELRFWRRGIQMLRLSEVETRLCFKKSHIYQEIDSGRLPAPVPLGGRRRAWVAHEVDEVRAKWLAERREDPAFRFLTMRMPSSGSSARS